MTSFPPPSTSEPVKREEQARDLCLRLLTVRARTRAELETRLTDRGFPDEVSTRVLDRLVEVGLLDDAAFAQEWVRTRRVNAGKGKRALAVELRKKGVDADVIAETLDSVDAGEWRVRAEELVAGKLRRENLDDEVKVTRRLVGLLARRGYNQGMAFDVVKTQLAQERERRSV
ncbi:recombination regulator RecX [Mycolicibacterium diernhoferi]|uniref:Regulatory protein RecX n=1 Tax=Mycolicibacterium diernhoferi TaxID=1801 RepID=A0A1Q4HAP9_9MYCO|nr:recombination regulator RecX [Mycolicibacterium diernhoferi]OJZ64619.1 recombination regulator RecX [Mycolicibacterium diernhoferi]OPE54726.1 recombination regulator RecX [Mycolicibacterium diernhoferi]PEG51230.1 recombination regulator RecX [Mycolicibacterium diernhoferi]QYL24943.1 recombination regulator RecX [Mycolicibacterium diernhoferi]